MWKINAMLILLIIAGFASKEEPIKTFTARQVAEGKVFLTGLSRLKFISEGFISAILKA